MAGVPSHRPGELRHAALAIIDHFSRHGAPDHGTLSIGWHRPWPALAQAYSGPGSPYWASKGMLGLALGRHHPVWTDDDGALPVEQDDVLRSIAAPGWIVSGTRSDGIVRVINHGTDHAREGDQRADSPLYARLGYSTATAPLLDDKSWVRPLDQCVCLVDDEGNATHRSGMRTTELRVDGTGSGAVAVAASTSRVRWIEADAVQERHGSGYTGRAVEAGSITVASLVRGAYEIRLAAVHDLTETGRFRSRGLRIGGWPVAADEPIVVSVDVAGAPVASVRSDRVISRVYASTSDATASTTSNIDASPLGRTAIVPWLLLPVQEGRWTACMVELSGANRGESPAPIPPPVASFDAETRGNEVIVTWPDGARTTTQITQVFPLPKQPGAGEEAARRVGPPRY
jgi:hypothetical protein